MDYDERQQRLQEMNIVEIAYDRLRLDACVIDIKLAKARLFLQHQTVADAQPAGDDALESWLPKTRTIDYERHVPVMALQEMERFQAQIAAEVKMFEDELMVPGRPAYAYERCRMDLEDGRVLLKAVDKVVLEMERAWINMEKTATSQAADTPTITARKTDLAGTGKIDSEADVKGTDRERKV
jgi:hypothetical protein